MDSITLLSASLVSVVIFVVARKLLIKRDQPKETQSKPSPTFGSATGSLAAVLPTSNSKRTRLSKDLLLSGNHLTSAVDDFLAKRNAGVLLCVLVFCFVFAIGVADGFEAVLLVVASVVSLLAYSLPRLALTGKATRRKNEIEKAIPDSMDMIAMSIQGGLSLPVAIGQVSRRMHRIYPALSAELDIVFRQTESGAAEEAYESFSHRIDIPEVITWCAMMRQSQKLGGGLAQSLRDYASRIRIDRESRAERSGNTASLKLLLPVVLCLAPPIAVILVGPAVIDLRDFINREKGTTQAALEQVIQQ